jgi:trans-2,3-dihydro-3-hydroxyanthranilate isomerase
MAKETSGTYRYRLVDVFTREQFQGNQLAVFLDAQGLDGPQMQRIARELNLAETAFIFPASSAGCVAQVRIFTSAKEMAFAGHPTIGTAFVLREAGLVASSISEFKLQENVGPVSVRIATDGSGILWLRTPAIHWGKTFDAALCARVLGLTPDDLLDGPVTPQLLNAGNPTLLVPLASRESVDRAWLSTG